MAHLPAPAEGIAITHFIVSRDVERSRRSSKLFSSALPSARPFADTNDREAYDPATPDQEETYMMRLGRALVAALLFAASAHAAWRSEGPFLGAVTDVAVDPVNPDTIYAATGSGGVWRSDDGGKRWMLPGDDMVN